MTAAVAIFALSSTAIADTIKDIPAMISVSSASTQSFGQLKAYPGLFGTAEKRSESLKAFTKWTGMFKRFERELMNGRDTELVQDLKVSLKGYQKLNLKTMARKVNNLMNSQPYILDNRNWGQSDYWATPIEFLKRGGDCEDFAIAKYTALRSLGVPEHRLRLAIVHDNDKNIPHAVLVVYTNEGVYILDNQIKTLVDASDAGRYRPIFSINREAWWLHTSPKATVVASAE